MTSPTIQTPNQAIIAVQNYLMANGVGALPEVVAGALQEVCRPGQVAPMAAVKIAEAIYATRDELPAELLEIGAQAAMMCHAFNFDGIATDDRGALMALTIRQMDSVATKMPKLVGEPPAPKLEFVAAPVDLVASTERSIHLLDAVSSKVLEPSGEPLPTKSRPEGA